MAPQIGEQKVISHFIEVFSIFCYCITTALIWVKKDDPVIKHSRFTATGTRFLEANGRRAIVELYARSFNR